MRSFVKVRETGKTPCIATERRHQDRRAISVPLAGVNDGVSRYLHGGGPPRSAASRQDEKALCKQEIRLPRRFLSSVAGAPCGPGRLAPLPRPSHGLARHLPPQPAMINLSYRSLIPDVRQVWLQAQPGSGEAAFDKPGLVLDFLQAVPDDLDQVGEAGDGEVGQDAALEHGPDPFHRVEVRGVGRELGHAQPCLGSGEGAQLGAEMDVEVIPDQDDDPAGQLAVRGDQQVTVLTPGERLGLALAPPVQVQPPDQAGAVAGPVAGQPGDGDVPGAAAADADDRGDPAPRPGPGPRRPQRPAGPVPEDDPAAQGRRRPFTRGQVSFFHTSMALSAMVAAWVASLPCVPGPPLSGGTAVVVIAASLPAPPGVSARAYRRTSVLSAVTRVFLVLPVRPAGSGEQCLSRSDSVHSMKILSRARPGLCPLSPSLSGSRCRCGHWGRPGTRGWRGFLACSRAWRPTGRSSSAPGWTAAMPPTSPRRSH